MMFKQDQWLTNLGARLKAEREKQGLTQQTLANKSDTKQDYIAQLERGSRNPSLRTFVKVLSALDISADYLIYDSNKEKSDEMDEILNDFTTFLSRKTIESVTTYYKIVRFLSKYIDVDCGGLDNSR